MRHLFLILLLPFALAQTQYTIALYTGGDVHVERGEARLLLPFPEGNNCLPVAVLYVEGGKDYPVIQVNDQRVVGGGVHRVRLEGNAVLIRIRSVQPATLLGKSLILCTKDPFLELNYKLGTIRIGNYNYVDVVIKNYGYSDVNARLLLNFHPDLAPFYPAREWVLVPARKGRFSFVSVTYFLVAAPFVLKPSSHKVICIEYRDSISLVRRCVGPVPAPIHIEPHITCIDGRCINTSNLVLEANGLRLRPGDSLSEGELAKLEELNLQIIKKEVSGNFGPKEGEGGLRAIILATLAVIAGLAVSVFFK